jgi:hypothetical protein
MWQSKREISQECNDIIGLAKGSQISVYVLDHHFNSPFVYIDNRDFLRENGEVGLVLGIRERP